MNVVIAPKQSSLRPRLVEATIFLQLTMSLIPNNPADVMEFPIWKTLIPSRPKLPDDIDDSDDNDDNEDDNEDDDLSLVPAQIEETNYMC